MPMSASTALLAFEAGGEALAVDAAAVREIVDVPRITRVPNARACVEGVANIRGAVVPILSVSALRGRQPSPGKRVLILDQQPPVGLLIDTVASLGAASANPTVDLETLLKPALRVATGAKVQRRHVIVREEAEPEAAKVALVAFSVGPQEFALPLEHVNETIALSSVSIAPMPRSDAAVVGTIHYRDTLLPVLALGALLALPSCENERRAIIVTLVAGRPVGLVVDKLQSVLQLSPNAIEPVPSIIARRTSEAKISAICRLEGGRRLISVLDSMQIIQGIDSSQFPELDAMTTSEKSASDDMTDPFVVFQIGNQSFGLPASAVEEIVQRPKRLTKIPRAPDFVEGLADHRGQAIPIIDQRARFGASTLATSRDRVIIVALGDLQAGFVVDQVNDILRLPASSVTSAPDIADATKVFDRIATLKDGQQLVLLIDPAELLDSTERNMLTALRNRALAKS